MREWNFPNRTGALVTGVKPGGPSQVAEPPLQYGDVILKVGDKAIGDLGALVEQYGALMDRPERPERLLVEFDRQGENLVTVIEPKDDQDEDPPREVPKAWIGIETQPVLRNLVEELAGIDRVGYRVTRIYPGSEAEAGPLEVGDIIIALNGEELRPKGMQDAGLFERAVRRLEIGDTATLKVLRGGEEREVKATLERTRLRPEEARRDRNRDFELLVRELTYFDPYKFRWEKEIQGVLVEEVEDAGWAGLGGLRTWDLIQKIDGTAITDIESYRAVMNRLAEQQPERVVMVVRRGSRNYFQFIEPDWRPIMDERSANEPSEE
jgi:serine protease Do